MDPEKKKFRGKFGGYNKKDVNNYIAEENKRFTNEREEMKKALDDSEALSASLSDQLEKQKAESDELRAKLGERDLLIEDYKEKIYEKDTRISDLEEMIDTLSREKDDGIFAKETADEKDRRIAELVAAADQYIAEIARLKEVKEETGEKVIVDDSLLEKARSYDSLSDKIDDILEYARQEAHKIIKVAEKAAKADAEGKRTADVARVKQSIATRSTSIIDEIRRMVKASRK